MLSVVVTAYEADAHLLDRAANGLVRQTDRDFEVVCVTRGVAPGAAEVFRGCGFAWRWLPSEPNDRRGDVERRAGLECAKGDKVTWLSADNAVYPGYVATHNRPGVVVANIDFWRGHRYRGLMPRALRRGYFDLTCFSLPRDAALQADAFGPWCDLAHSDWDTFERASRGRPVTWDRTAPPVAVHF